MRFFGALVGTIAGVGFFVWMATNGAPPLGAPAVAGLAMLGTFFGFAIGYGCGNSERQ